MSAPIIPVSDRAWMTTVVGGFLQTPCRIQRFASGWSTISADGLLCWVRADAREQALPGTAGTQQMRRWRITLPDGQDVRRGDRILALGTAYGVDEIIVPTSNSINTTVFAYALWTVDADGNPTGPPLYLSFNATLDTQRDGVDGNVLTGIPAQANPAKLIELPIGAERSQTIQIGPNQSVLPGDYLILTYYSGAVRTGKATFTDEVDEGGMQSMTLTVIGGLLPT